MQRVEEKKSSGNRTNLFVNDIRNLIVYRVAHHFKDGGTLRSTSYLGRELVEVTTRITMNYLVFLQKLAMQSSQGTVVRRKLRLSLNQLVRLA